VTINQHEWLRFLGGRAQWDVKMAAVVASVATAVCVFFNLVTGPLGQVDDPDLKIVARSACC
jgi:hypothetical protein